MHLTVSEQIFALDSVVVKTQICLAQVEASLLIHCIKDKHQGLTILKFNVRAKMTVLYPATHLNE